MIINIMTTQAPSNVIEPEIVISVEQPENEDNTDSCITNISRKKESSILCYVYLASAGLILIGLMVPIFRLYI